MIAIPAGKFSDGKSKKEIKKTRQYVVLFKEGSNGIGMRLPRRGYHGDKHNSAPRNLVVSCCGLKFGFGFSQKEVSR